MKVRILKANLMKAILTWCHGVNSLHLPCSVRISFCGAFICCFSSSLWEALICSVGQNLLDMFRSALWSFGYVITEPFYFHEIWNVRDFLILFNQVQYLENVGILSSTKTVPKTRSRWLRQALKFLRDQSARMEPHVLVWSLSWVAVPILFPLIGLFWNFLCNLSCLLQPPAWVMFSRLFSWSCFQGVIFFYVVKWVSKLKVKNDKFDLHLSLFSVHS